MKTHSFWLRISQQLLIAAIAGKLLAITARAQNTTNSPTPRPVTTSSSSMIKGAEVYSIKFPGGSAADFFEFLRTNGFANDNVLFAGRAARIHIPPFSVRHVRLKDVAKSIELVSEGRLNVEIVEKGVQSDENIWRIRASDEALPIRTKTCAMPNFFTRRGPNAELRIPVIVEAVEKVLGQQLDISGRTHENGSAHVLGEQKIVVVVGPDQYVEAVSSALEAAEKVAAAESEALKPK